MVGYWRYWMGSMGNILRHEAQLEWRQRSALGGLMLYASGAVYICFVSMGMQAGAVKGPVWNSLVWIILLFTCVSAIGKSFGNTQNGQHLYYYGLVPPSAFLMAKILYNTLFTSLLGLLSMVLFMTMLGNPVHDPLLFASTIVLGAFTLSATLTLVAGIVARVNGNGTLLPILGFPITIPQLLLLIRLSKHAMDGLESSYANQGLWSLLGLGAMLIALSYLLFPYLWRS